MTGSLTACKGKIAKIIRMLLVCTFLVSPLFLGAACTKSEVDIKPVEIKPIHITLDINVKVDRALDNYFGDLDKMQKKENSGK